jgi:hypothetical protein
MNIKCPICAGRGYVSKDFGLGNCKKIEGKEGTILEQDYRVCPGCNGTGIQWEDTKPTTYPPRVIIKTPKKKPTEYIRG